MGENNDDQPATKKDLRELEERLENDVTTVETRLLTAMQQTEERLMHQFTETLEATGTKLLRAFYSFAEATQKNMADLRRTEAVTQDRLVSLETRVLEIEKRLNMPPHAA